MHFLPLVFAALGTLLGVGAREAPRSVTPRPAAITVDTVLTELGQGRFWHVARSLRAAGAATGSPAEILLLARAEAGWGNWPAVAELLGGADWLDAEDEGTGWRLLGHALELRGEWEGAARAYERFLLSGATNRRADRLEALVRRARVLDRLGDSAGALGAIDTMDDPAVASWTALDLAGRAAERGDTARTAALLGRVVDDEPAREGWRMLADARLAAGDTAGGADELRRALAGAGRRDGSAAVELGLLVLSLGDTLAAERLLQEGLDEARGPWDGRAAAALYRLDPERDTEALLRFARILDRDGEGAVALAAYDRAARRLAAEGAALPDRVRVERARLMSTVRSRQQEALEEFRAIRESTDDERAGARNLEVWATMRRRQGLPEHVATLRRWLLEEHPRSAEAAEVLWDRASAVESRGDREGALALYTTLAENAGSHARAGEARMRIGQIHLSSGHPGEAAAVFDQYLADFPTGRRWDEAAYWAARAHLTLGDTATATARVERINRQDFLSYYAVMGEQLLGRDYRFEVPEGAAAVEPPWLTEGLELLDVLAAAGLDHAVEAQIEALRRRARPEGAVTLRLAQALIARGRTLAGIQIGWQMVADGRPWDRRLAEVVFPFPYRELVAHEAGEWNVDPMLVAALIRQESAFEAGIVSHAGAVGLMQVMPTTGRELARRHGPEGFQDGSLTVADVNIHLGAAYFAQMSARFSGDLLLVLTAYNAGPTRARRWTRLRNASDAVGFAERIPIPETRGYVMSVQRNLAIYQALYGDDG